MIRTQTNTPSPAAPPASGMQKHAPYLSAAPWAGFTADDHPRAVPLELCPARRCRRAKQCLAAHADLYCQRTHYSKVEHRALHPKLEDRHLPRIRDAHDLEARRERLVLQIEQRQAAQDAMTKRWMVGEFDNLYGKYDKRGVLMKPPPKLYIDLTARNCATAAQPWNQLGTRPQHQRHAWPRSRHTYA